MNINVTGCNTACQEVIGRLQEEHIHLQNALETSESTNDLFEVETQKRQESLEEMFEQCENNSAQLKTEIDELNDEIESLQDVNDKLHNALVLILSGQTNRFGNSYYYVSNTTLGWYNANTSCNSLGATLVEINNKAEHDFVVQLVKEKVDNSAWVGGAFVESEGVWRWDASMDLIGDDAYTNWAPGQPASESRTRCVQLWKQRGYKWDDFLCHIRRYFVCEIWLQSGLIDHSFVEFNIV